MTTPIASTDLLIAPPGLPDPRFRNTVLMLTHTYRSGSFALCVNKPTAHTLDEIVEAADVELEHVPKVPIYWGGPVSPNSLWMLHSPDWYIPKVTVEINQHWYMTSSLEMFQHLADGDYPRHFRIVTGHCSWAPGQLDCEIEGLGPWRREHSWLVAHNLGPEWLFEQAPEELWASATTLSSHQAIDSWL